MPFIKESFLLQNNRAEKLYANYSRDLPIIDYHCHISPKDIAENRQFDNITQVWLYGDHYKWRAMRTAGVPEDKITGNASDLDKFRAWAKVVPKTLGNPLFHWTHLELLRYFDVSDLLNPKSADSIWEKCNELLSQPELSTRGIINKMNVQVVCTTDDPVDSLEYHKKIAADASVSFKMLPAFRPDKAMAIDNPELFTGWLQKLSQASGIDISSYDKLLEALQIRHDYFHENGCRLSDHGLEKIYDEEASLSDVQNIFAKAISGKEITPVELKKYQSALLLEFARMDHDSGWVQQFHLGAIRNVNSKMYRKLGPDTGYDSMGDFSQISTLARFLDRLNSEDKLAKTILYNVNPNDNPLFATMIGNFQDGITPGKMQFGSAWWFLDQKDGIEKQLNSLANMGLLSHFVGMLTDSRSFLSYPRHEYFRRVLCNILGTQIEKGLLPDDLDLVGSMVSDISYNNARTYFDFF